jgi:hypothetical protein
MKSSTRAKRTQRNLQIVEIVDIGGGEELSNLLLVEGGLKMRFLPRK